MQLKMKQNLPWNEFPSLVFWVKIVLMVSADLTGTVDFSTTILKPTVSEAILLEHASTYFKSAARPFPTPYVFVGVLTEMKIKSALLIYLSTSEEKNKFRPRATFYKGDQIVKFLWHKNSWALIKLSFHKLTTLSFDHFIESRLINW